MRKYKTNLNNMITLRAKEELIKTESFGSKKYDADNFAMHRKFCYIAKFRYHNEISLYREISTYSENFAMHKKFRYHREISLCSEISTFSKNFAMIAKLPLSSCLLPGSSSLLFLHPMLDEIDENLYELGINQHNFDAKIDMMVKVYKTCKNIKNNLETKLVVLKDLHMSIGLNNMIGTQKALKTYLK